MGVGEVGRSGARNPYRKPAEVHPGTGLHRGWLEPQADSGNRDLEFASDHLSERSFLTQEKNAAHLDRRRQARETHRQRPVARTERPGQHGLGRGDVHATSRHRVYQTLPGELPIGGGHRFPVHTESLAQRAHAGKPGAFLVPPVANPRLEAQGDLPPRRNFHIAVNAYRRSRSPAGVDLHVTPPSIGVLSRMDPDDRMLRSTRLQWTIKRKRTRAASSRARC